MAIIKKVSNCLECPFFRFIYRGAEIGKCDFDPKFEWYNNEDVFVCVDDHCPLKTKDVEVIIKLQKTSVGQYQESSDSFHCPDTCDGDCEICRGCNG